ncbi:hypothetical protein Acsp05_25160 [Actinokineospora sp. NBRC 105648]|nr:hypothetical protein Acsp05_25160 [Actinokineospora sp. NBRC 105648]
MLLGAVVLLAGLLAMRLAGTGFPLLTVLLPGLGLVVVGGALALGPPRGRP